MKTDDVKILAVSIAVALAAVLGIIGMATMTQEPEPRNWMEQVAIEECGDVVPDGPIRVLKEAGWSGTHVQDIWVFERTDGSKVHVFARPAPGTRDGVRDGFDCSPEAS